MTRLPLLLPALALALVACGSPGSGEPLAAASPTAPATPEGGAPVLQLVDRCYGACGYLEPLGLPRVAVYADGRVVRSERRPPFDRPAVLTTGPVDAATRDRLVALARDADLDTGGRTALSYPQGPVFADGGADVLTGRLDGRTTTVESPQAFDPGLDGASSDPPRRRALRELAEALRALPADRPYAPPAVVLHAEPAGPSAREDGAWDGPALADLPRGCALLTGGAAARVQEQVADDAFPTVYTDGGQRWRVQARGVLPHEQDCDDVRETVRTATGGPPAAG